jgi:Na+/proline symporter
MDLHPLDIAIVVLYMLGMVAVGFVVERRARGGLSQYFLGNHQMPWWALSMSNAASMFDVSGTMWLVSLLYVYGLKSVFIPWLWPVFNQIFLMVYLSSWLRRSGALTGAEWITLRFGSDRGAEVSRISVVIFALVSVVAFTGYAFVGIAKFSDVYLPDILSPKTYALIIIGVTTLYTVVGGLYGVVVTDLVQFFIKLICSLAIGIIAMRMASPETLAAVVPPGWGDMSFGWKLDLDWSRLMPAAQTSIDADGYTMFGAFFMMMVFKGVLVSVAGPAPNYDMQRILAAKSPKEAAMMSGLVTVVLFTPRFFMIAGITVLALLLMGDRAATATTFDLEQVLPIVIHDYLPIGLRGFMIAGLLAAFMSTFSGTINAAAAYIVNDIYKQYLRPTAKEREYVRASYVASIVVVIAGCAAGFLIPSVATATNWIVSGLWVGYAAPNVLKWHWWRINGLGYFWGMITGIGGAVVIALSATVKYWMAFPSLLLISLWSDAPASSFELNLMAFPMLLLVSLTATLAGTLLSKTEEESVLVDFYTRTRPWGWWGPIHQAAVRRDPQFQANRDFARDMFNVVVGIVWQTAFVALPIYVVIRDWHAAGTCLAIIVATSTILKRTWYDRLQDV